MLPLPMNHLVTHNGVSLKQSQACIIQVLHGVPLWGLRLVDEEVQMPKKAPVINVPDGFAKRLGEAIQVGRVAAGINRDELAESLGVAKSTFIKWEQGVRIPEGHVIAQICRLLGLDANLVLGLATDSEFDQVRSRVLRLVKSAGREQLATRIAIASIEIDQLLASRILVFSSSGIECVAAIYGVSPKWLRTGNPKDWTPGLQSILDRLRYFLVCHGLPLSAAEGIEIQYSPATGTWQICADESPVADLEGLILALRGSGAGSADFPFDLGWVVTG